MTFTTLVYLQSRLCGCYVRLNDVAFTMKQDASLFNIFRLLSSEIINVGELLS